MTMDITNIQALLNMGFTHEQVAQMCGGAGKGVSKGKKKPDAPKVKDTPFTKKDGTVVMMTAKEAASKEAWRNKEHLSLDEVKAITFDGKFTAEMDAWLIANQGTSCKDFKAANKGARGCTKEQLKAHRNDMRAKGLIK